MMADKHDSTPSFIEVVEAPRIHPGGAQDQGSYWMQNGTNDYWERAIPFCNMHAHIFWLPQTRLRPS